jgi:hypothetical protein
MRSWMISLVTMGALLTTAIPAVAQTRPHVSGSETSHRSGPTCVVNGDASACEGSSAGGVITLLPGPVIIGVSPVMSPAMSPILGGSTDGRASTDTDVNRSSRNGNALVR